MMQTPLVLTLVLAGLFMLRAEAQTQPGTAPTTAGTATDAKVVDHTSDPAFTKGFEFAYGHFSGATPAPLRVGKEAKQKAASSDAIAALEDSRDSLKGTWARIEKSWLTATPEQQGLAIGASLALARNAQTELLYAGLDNKSSSKDCQIPNNAQRMNYFDTNDRSFETAKKRVGDTILYIDSARKCIGESQYQQGTGQKVREGVARIGIGGVYHDKKQQVANLNAQHDAKIGDSLKKDSGQFEGVLSANGYPQ